MAGGIRILILSFLLMQIMPLVYSSGSMLLPDTCVSQLPHYALGRGPLVDCSWMQNTETNKGYGQTGFGVRIPVAFFDITENMKVDFGGYGWDYTKFNFTYDGTKVVESDYLLGNFISFKYYNYLFETLLYHTSGHIGDEFILYGNGRVITLGYEAIRQYVNYDFDNLVNFSAGFEYKVDRRPYEFVFYDKSFLLGFRLDLMKYSLPFYLDSECEIFSFEYAMNFGCRLGYYLNFFNFLNQSEDKKSTHRHEIYLAYYNGYSKYLYFYNKRESYILAGGALWF